MTNRGVQLFQRYLWVALGATVVLLAAAAATPSQATSRIKDIAIFEGVRDNLLIGYGLVVGLNGTGDSLRNAPFTRQSLEAMLERLGVNTRQANLNTDTVAAVIVSADLPAFARHGRRIDVSVSAMGDAKSLLGGVLLVTPLMGADGEVYAVAQGPVAAGGFSAQGEGQTITKGVPTSGRIPNGAIVEREIEFELASLRSLRISLRNPDLTTARRVAGSINAFLGTQVSRALDPATVQLFLPQNYEGNLVALLTEIEQLQIEPDQRARVLIDETTGIIVMGENVRVDTVGIAHGNLTIRITETPQVSQPAPFSNTGETTTVPRTDIEIDEADDQKIMIMNPGISLQELIDGLNSLGVGPRDMISILQAIKAAGALQADIELM
jgi:flagellar P-ring protein precursor FlgI